MSGPFKIEKNQRNSISSTILKSEDTSMALPSRKSINSGCLSPIVFSRKNTISSSLFEPEDEPDSHAIEIYSLSSCGNEESSFRRLGVNGLLKKYGNI